MFSFCFTFLICTAVCNLLRFVCVCVIMSDCVFYKVDGLMHIYEIYAGGLCVPSSLWSSPGGAQHLTVVEADDEHVEWVFVV